MAGGPSMRSDYQRGDPLPAADLNEIVRAVVRALDVRGGPGVVVHRTGSGVIIGLAGAAGGAGVSGGATIVVPSVVTARSVSAADFPDAVTYTVKPRGNSDHPGWDDLTPKVRIFSGSSGVPKVTPAPVGARCEVWLHPDGEGSGDLRPELMWVAEEEWTVSQCATTVARSITLSASEILDHVLTDRDGRVLVDRLGNVLGDRLISDTVAAAYLDPVLTDRDGDVLTDRLGRPLLDRNASDAAIAFWDDALTDRDCELLVDRLGNLLWDRRATVES